MEANIMAGRAPLALMLMAVMLSSGLAGCLGDEALELLPEKKGVPGGLTLACLRSSMYTSMVIEIDQNRVIVPIQAAQTCSSNDWRAFATNLPASP